MAFFAILIMALFFYTELSSVYIVGGLIIVLLVDLVPIDRIYLGTEKDGNDNYVHWKPAPEIAYPISSLAGDLKIIDMEINENPVLQKLIDKGAKKGENKADDLEYSGKDKRRVIDSYKFSALNENTNYRVYDVVGNWGSSRASYFHKSLGGYHGAKLRSIQHLEN